MFLFVPSQPIFSKRRAAPSQYMYIYLSAPLKVRKKGVTLRSQPGALRRFSEKVSAPGKNTLHAPERCKRRCRRLVS